MQSPTHPTSITARRLEWVAATAIVGIGGWLRLRGLSSMEFKYDEQQALVLAARVGLAPSQWPTHGMLSSNGIPNAPLFTMILAAMRLVGDHPVTVAALVATINTLCLVPLWLWLRRQMDGSRALIALGIVRVSPFAVFFSRKIWTQDLLLPGVLLILWGTEWLRKGRTWPGIISLSGAVLVAGQLHQSGPIGLVLLVLALAVQYRVDRRAGLRWPIFTEPTVGQTVALVALMVLNLVFWLPYLTYLSTLPLSRFYYRPHSPTFGPFLLWRIVGQISPSELFYFFDQHRFDFLRDPVRSAIYQGSIVLGFPLAVYGVWRWLRAPLTVPVVGVWWGLVIAVFMLATIPTYTFYTLILTPVVGVVAAGAFDPGAMRRSVERVLHAWRVAYVFALLALTLVTQRWIEQRGGAWQDYGVSYDIRESQARYIGALLRREPTATTRGLALPDEALALWCNPPNFEVRWLVRWLDEAHSELPQSLKICDGWIAHDDGLRYRWRVESQ